MNPVFLEPKDLEQYKIVASPMSFDGEGDPDFAPLFFKPFSRKLLRAHPPTEKRGNWIDFDFDALKEFFNGNEDESKMWMEEEPMERARQIADYVDAQLDECPRKGIRSWKGIEALASLSREGYHGDFSLRKDHYQGSITRLTFCLCLM
jgi:hypothetical protein